jgi:Kelch motif
MSFRAISAFSRALWIAALATSACSRTTIESESPAARSYVDAQRTRFQLTAVDPDDLTGARKHREPAFAAGVADRFERRGARLTPRFARPTNGTALELPATANGRFQLRHEESGVAIAARLRDARSVEAEVGDGLLVYRGAHASGADLLQRPSPEGTEDLLVFQGKPPAERIDYEIELGGSVAGLRLVANTLEFLDKNGVPRLRVSPPWLAEAGGERRDATLAVTGCAFDQNPAAPWGREVTPPGASTCALSVSWADAHVAYPALLDPSWTFTNGPLAAPRYEHVAVRLNDNTVLVAGGLTTGAVYVATAEIYNPTANAWAATNAMSVARGRTAAVKLVDGTVLVAGGFNSSAGGTILSSAESYNSGTGQWTAKPAMATPRAYLTLTLIDSGEVLAINGASLLTDFNTCCMGTSSIEKYTPGGAWSAMNPISNGRYRHTAMKITTGPDAGYVMVWGGEGGNNGLSEIYDPTTGNGTIKPSPGVGERVGHTMTLLADGKIFVAGGGDNTGVDNYQLFDPLAPIISSVTNGNLGGVGRTTHVAALLGTGKVLIAGGTTDGVNAITDSRQWDPGGLWVSLDNLLVSRRLATATVLASGNVLVAGGLTGNGTGNPTATSEIYQACPADILTDPDNCGGCGNVCSNNHMATRTCAGGVCNGACAAGFADCNGNKLTDGCETDILASTSNCGGCGNVCSLAHASSATCNAGTCSYVCIAPFADCNTTPPNTNGCEADTSTDANNCGSCAHSCNDGVACTNDSCFASTCRNINAPACVVPWCQIGGGCAGPDTDFDGLSDTWEVNGYVDVNCNGQNDAGDIALPGANPAVPDVYVKYDYMAIAGLHSHQPPAAALTQVVQSFAARGVTLHFIAPGGPLTETTVTTFDPAPNPACAGNSFTTMSTLRAQNLGTAQVAYHYMVFAHRAVCPDIAHCLACPLDAFCSALPDATSTGSSDLPGDDTIISFGPFIDANDPIGIELWASTIMHELGHNFGLKHGAENACVNLKPNYMSIMNYTYQLNGILESSAAGSTAVRACASDAECGPPAVSSGPCATANACHCTDDLAPVLGTNICYRTDYSGNSLLGLNEAVPVPGTGGLDENAGVGGPGTDTDLVLYYAPGPTQLLGPSNSSPIDWDNSGGIANHVQSDINNDNGFTFLTTQNDWAQSGGAFTFLNLRHQCTAGYGPGGSAAWSTNEPSRDLAINKHFRYPPRQMTVDVRPGCTNNWIKLGAGNTATSTVSYTGGGCTVCGGPYGCVSNDTRNYTDTSPANSLVTKVRVTLHGTDCSGGTVSVYINGALVGTTNQTYNCGCGTCQTYPDVQIANILGIPGYVAGGTNSIRVTTSSGVTCLHDATVNATYGSVPVAILGTINDGPLYVGNIDTKSLHFGGASAQMTSLQDVNGDGFVDLVALFDMPSLNLASTTTTAVVTASYTNSTSVIATGPMTIVGAPQACVPPCSGWVYNGGCWYTSVLGQNCSQTCANHGGFNSAMSQHTGHPVCSHFYPLKANGGNWTTVECCSTDNNTNWGATGAVPDPNFSHPACYVACACNN